MMVSPDLITLVVMLKARGEKRGEKAVKTNVYSNQAHLKGKSIRKHWTTVGMIVGK